MTTELEARFRKAVPYRLRNDVAGVVRRKGTGVIVVKVYDKSAPIRLIRGRNIPAVKEYPLLEDFDASVALWAMTRP